MAKGKKLGERVTVKIGTEKIGNKNVPVYSYMLKSVADFYGFKAEKSQPTITVKKGNKSYKRIIRGVRSNAIKVPAGTSTKGGKTSTKFHRIPVGQVNLVQVSAFVKKASKNKPKYFVSPEGRQYPISGTK